MQTIDADIKTIAIYIKAMAIYTEAMTGDIKTIAIYIKAIAADIKALSIYIEAMANYIQTLATNIPTLGGDSKAKTNYSQTLAINIAAKGNYSAAKAINTATMAVNSKAIQASSPAKGFSLLKYRLKRRITAPQPRFLGKGYKKWLCNEEKREKQKPGSRAMHQWLPIRIWKISLESIFRRAEKKNAKSHGMYTRVLKLWKRNETKNVKNTLFLDAGIG